MINSTIAINDSNACQTPKISYTTPILTVLECSQITQSGLLNFPESENGFRSS